MQLNYSASSLNSLPTIDEIEPIGHADEPCLAEVLAVLKKHGKANRFGIALLHKHFDLEHGEVLVEETDTRTRIQTVGPQESTPELLHDVVATVVRLGDGSVMASCIQTCVKDFSSNRHNRKHVKMGGL